MDKVWLRAQGQVIGVDLEWLNQKIREYNRVYYKYSDFWSWLNWDEGIGADGFSVIWNDHNHLMAKVLTIRDHVA